MPTLHLTNEWLLLLITYLVLSAGYSMERETPTEKWRWKKEQQNLPEILVDIVKKLFK